MTLPPRLPPLRGLLKLGEWLNQLRDLVAANTLQPGLNYKLTRTAQGTTLQIAPSAAGGASVRRFLIQQVLTDSLRCHELNGATPVPVDVYVAKPWQFMDQAYTTPFPALPGPEGPNGWTVGALADVTSGDGERQSRPIFHAPPSGTIGTHTTVQFISPRYHSSGNTLGSIIVAASCRTGLTQLIGAGPVLQPLDWIDLNVDGRRWEAPLNLFEACVSGSPYITSIRAPTPTQTP